MGKFLLFLSLLVQAYSCKKESVKLIPSEVLMSSKWQISSLLVENPAGSSPADITTGSYKTCERDDLIEFKTGGSYACSENQDVCAVNASVFYALNGGSWLITGDTLLSISAGFILQNFRLGKITKTTVELRQTVPNYFGEFMVYRFNLKAAP